MSSSFDLADRYWTAPLTPAQTYRSVVASPPHLHTLAEALAAGHEQRQLAEWNMRHMAAWNAGEIGRLEMWMRRPPVFVVAAIREIMDHDLSGGEFPTTLVDAYQDHNGFDLWPLLETAGFTRDADNDRTQPPG